MAIPFSLDAGGGVVVGKAQVLVSPELDKSALAKMNAQIQGALKKAPPAVIHPVLPKGKFLPDREINKVRDQVGFAMREAGRHGGNMFADGIFNGIRAGEHSVKQGVARMNKNLENLTRQLRASGFEGYLMGQALTRAFTLPIGAAVGFGNAFGISVAATLERTQVALKALLPPGYDVQSLIQRLQKLAIESPVFNVAQVTQFTRQLVGAGVEGNRAVDVVSSLGKVFLAYGLSTEDAERATRGVYQAFAKGRLYAEELNQQISENLPATFLFAKAAQRLGLMTDYMNKGQEKATVSAQKLALKQRELAIYQQKIADSGKPMTATQKLHIDQLQLQIQKLQTLAAADKKAATGGQTLQGAFLAMVKEGEITSDVLDDIIIEVGKLPEIARGSAAAVSTMSFAFDRLKDSFQNAFANAFLKFSPQIQAGLNELTNNSQEFANAIISTTPAVINFLTAVVTKLTNLIRAYNDLSPGQQHFVKQTLLTLAAAGPLAFVLGRVFTVLGGASRFFLESAKATQYLTKTIRALTSAEYAAVVGTTALSRAMMFLWTSILLPIGIIGAIVIAVLAVIGVLVILYFKWKPFHDIVNKTAAIIKNALITAFHGLMTGIRAVGAAAVWFYQHALLPVWNALKAVGSFIKNVALTVFHALQTAFRSTAAAVSVVNQHLQPFFTAAKFGFMILAKTFEIAFRLIQVGLYWLGRLFVWLWQHAVKPAVDAMVSEFNHFLNGLRIVWDAAKFVTKVAWNFIYGTFIKPWISVLKGPAVAAFRIFKEQVVGHWEDFKKAAKIAWDFIKRFVIAPMNKVFGEELPRVFRGLVRALVDNFDNIGDGLLVAVRFAVKIINGFIRIINKIPGIKQIKELPLPGAPPKGNGGVGPQTKADKIKGAARGTPPRGAAPGWMWVGEQGPELMYFQGGEHVIPNPESVALSRKVAQAGGFAMGTPDWLDLVVSPKKIMDGFKGLFSKMTHTAFGGAISAVAKQSANGLMNFITSFFGSLGSSASGAFKGGPGVGEGGLQPAILALLRTLRRIFGNVPLISGYRAGARTLSGSVSYHASGRAIDIPPVQAWATMINRLYGGQLKELITPWNDLNILNGRPHRYTGAVWNQHNFAGGNAHIHAALDNGGWVPSGIPFVNNTGRPELMLNDAQARALEDRIRGDSTHVVEVYLDGQLIDTKIAHRIDSNERDIIRAMSKGRR